jgi:hypothetical protein
MSLERANAEPCQTTYDAEIAKAKRPGLTDVEDFLKALQPIPVVGADKNVICNVRLIEDVPPGSIPGGLTAEDRGVLLSRQVTLPKIANPIPGAFPGGADSAAKILKMDPKALEQIIARWKTVPCQYGQDATFKVCKDQELNASKPTEPATRADFAGIHLGDRLPDGLATLSRGGYLPDIEDKYVTLHLTCTGKSIAGYVIYPCNVGPARFKRKDPAGNNYAVLLEFTEMPHESSAARPAKAENRELRLDFSHLAASIIASEPRLGNVLVARITGTIQMPYSTSADKYASLAMEKYPDLTDKWESVPWHSAASMPNTGRNFDKFLLGSKDHCKYYDTGNEYSRLEYTNCVGVGINQVGLAVAIGDAWFASLRNEKTEQGMVDAAKKLDQQGQKPKF